MTDIWTMRAIDQFKKIEKLKHDLKHLEQGLSSLMKYVPPEEMEEYKAQQALIIREEKRCPLCERENK